MQISFWQETGNNDRQRHWWVPETIKSVQCKNVSNMSNISLPVVAEEAIQAYPGLRQPIKHAIFINNVCHLPLLGCNSN